jgi:polyferredoxin
MDKMGYARGLVRYDTQNAVDHKQTQVLRPRVIVYGVLLVALCIGFIVALAMRQPISLDVLHDRNTLYRTLETGEIENVYLLKLINKDSVPQRLIVSVQSEHDNADRYRLDPAIPAFTVPAGEVFNAAVRVRKNAWDDSAEASERHEERERDEAGVSEVRFEVRAENDPSLRASAEARFFAPRR